jgi:predicted aspartyl protease
MLTAVFIFTLTNGEAFARKKPAKKDFKRQKVNWRLKNNSQIKGIRYPQDKFKLKRTPKGHLKLKPVKTKAEPVPPADTSDILSPALVVNIIDTPPVAGFVPWVAVTTTSQRSEEMDFAAVPDTAPSSGFTAATVQTDYAIGIFDTGASAHVMSNAAAANLNIYNTTYMTDNYIQISGATGYVDARVSQPLGLYITSMANVISSGLTDTSTLMGETNVSLVAGQPVSGQTPDLPTAIGSPLSVYYTAVIDNTAQLSHTYAGQTYTGPKVDIYEHTNSAIPNYSRTVPLELRPLGALNVQYIMSFDFYDSLSGDIWDISYEPGSPSTITGSSAQSVFFVHAVDITDNGMIARDKDRFMLDTGAQVTVIGKRIGARLALDPENPDFEVEIQGVSGQVTYEPGFYLDSLTIPALGEWLVFNNVPVVLLDISSPEGGTLDGIIGMNLFTEFNLVLRGGGLFLDEDPYLALEKITSEDGLIGDIAPANTPDGKIDILDITALANAWLSSPDDNNWYDKADIAPAPYHDQKVNYQDFSTMAKSWQQNQ